MYLNATTLTSKIPEKYSHGTFSTRGPTEIREPKFKKGLPRQMEDNPQRINSTQEEVKMSGKDLGQWLLDISHKKIDSILSYRSFV